MLTVQVFESGRVRELPPEQAMEILAHLLGDMGWTHRFAGGADRTRDALFMTSAGGDYQISVMKEGV